MPVVILIAYLLGSIPFALLFARRRGTDLRQVGSGNIGATNLVRAAGLPAGLLVAVLDMSKGAASVLMAEYMTADTTAAAAAGVAAIVGHVYPVWLRFRGGKGVATACGVFSVLTPAAVIPAIVIFLVTAWATSYVSAGSVLATLSVSPMAYALGYAPAAVVAAIGAAALIVFRHRSNLARMRAGTERRLWA